MSIWTDMHQENAELKSECERLRAENQRLSAECEGCPMAEAEKLRAEVEALRKEVDEADRRAGAAERMHANGIDSRAAAERWKIEAKREAGYDIRKSFDVVWKEILAKAKKFDAMNECQSNG